MRAVRHADPPRALHEPLKPLLPPLPARAAAPRLRQRLLRLDAAGPLARSSRVGYVRAFCVSCSVTGMTPRTPPLLTEAAEYKGETAVVVACTQLGSKYSSSGAKRVLDGWVDLLLSPTSITDLQFTTRTPHRLFAALTGQPQLNRLVVKWGDYADLTPIGAMTALRTLELRGAAKVNDLRPLGSLKHLEHLVLEGFDTIEDPSPLRGLSMLRALELGGKWMTPRNGHISSIGFLAELPGLESILLHTLVVDDKDYSPLLELPRLKSVRVMKTRGMRPPVEELRRRLPWNG